MLEPASLNAARCAAESIKRATLLCIACAAAGAHAALPPLSESEQTGSATYVIEAQVVDVEAIDATEGDATNRFIITLYIERILKTDQQRTLAGSQIRVTTWQAGERPAGWAGPGGQHRLPRHGDSGLFYLDQHLELLTPNGWRQAEDLDYEE